MPHFAVRNRKFSEKGSHRPKPGRSQKQHQAQVSVLPRFLFQSRSSPPSRRWSRTGHWIRHFEERRGAQGRLGMGQDILVPEHPILRALAKMAQRGLGEMFAEREFIDGLGRRVLGWVQKVPSANWLLGVTSQPQFFLFFNF